MADRCILYYVTDRLSFLADERARRLRLLEKIAEAAVNGVDYIQLREKDLPARELEALAREAMRVIRENCKTARNNGELTTALLINSRMDIALASCAAGVHLRADDISPENVRAAWKYSGVGKTLARGRAGDPRISVSCHSVQEVAQASAQHADLALFGPIFEKKDVTETIRIGLEALREACRLNIRVLALGGITLENAESCLNAGAAGVAAIRLFQENDIRTIVTALRR
jgi:thiamine-phosphate pyrophosphorylase